MGGKQRAKFLTAIWGERFVEEFCRISLPSYLAEGNLPALAGSTDLETIILTSTKSVDAFRREPAFKVLEKICPVRFLFIDDLIVQGNYGVTLTLAYARGIMDSGEEQTNTYFVFMNADFILADGSLATLTKKMAEGHPCIMAPSLRACAEDVLPMLEAAVDRDRHQLTIAPRTMVDLALDNLHPTVIGKTVTQDFVSCSTHNQIYWQVDQNTLLVRHYLIFMQAIKPETPLQRVNSYCDYGFVPEMVPSGRFTILDDSDDFFMLELQPKEQEKHFIFCGSAIVGDLSSELSFWTTKQHRAFSNVDIVFHSKDLPASLGAVKQQASSFVQDVNESMAGSEVTHVNHYYWSMGVQAWLHLRNADNKPLSLPPELDDALGASVMAGTALAQSPRAASLYNNIISYFRRRALDSVKVPLWHHSWLDRRLLLDWLSEVKQKDDSPSLLVSDFSSGLPYLLSREHPFKVVSPLILLSPTLHAQWSAEIGGRARFGSVLFRVSRPDLHSVRRVLDKISDWLEPSAIISVLIESEGEVGGINLATEIAQQIHCVLPSGWMGYKIKACFIGSRWQFSLRRIQRRLFSRVWPPPTSLGRLFGAPFAGIAYLAIAALTAFNNWRLRDKLARSSNYCSSAMITLYPSAQAYDLAYVPHSHMAESPPNPTQPAEALAQSS